jgi:hypothetical protein
MTAASNAQLSLLPRGAIVTPTAQWCQRWRDGDSAWRHLSDGGFDQRRYQVTAIPSALAKPFVVQHHYSGTYPAAKLAYGLWGADELLGVAVLSIPTHPGVCTNVFPTLTPYHEAVELGRFVLADSVEANGESWFLARVFRLAAREGIAGVVAFSDPVPRLLPTGQVGWVGHWGCIYQASNARYLGRTPPRRKTLLPDGTTFNERSRSKLLRMERGHAYVEEQLRRLGAPPRRGDIAQWLPIALAAIGAQRVVHAGCHRYGFALTRGVQVLGHGGPYPKRADPVTDEQIIATGRGSA